MDGEVPRLIEVKGCLTPLTIYKFSILGNSRNQFAARTRNVAMSINYMVDEEPKLPIIRNRHGNISTCSWNRWKSMISVTYRERSNAEPVWISWSGRMDKERPIGSKRSTCLRRQSPLKRQK